MKLDWRQGILYITTMGMEGCWLYALMAMLNKPVADGRLSILGILLIYPISFGFNRLLQRLRCPQAFLRSLSWLLWLVAMLLIVKVQLFGDLPFLDLSWLLAVPRGIAQMLYSFTPELLILVSTAVLWWLGRRLACLTGDFAALVGEFQFGLVILLIIFFVASQLGIDLTHPVYLTLLFFLFALLGISVAHALEGTSWLSGLYQGHWSGLLLVSVSLILILGLLISFISSVAIPDLLQLLMMVLKWLWGLVMKVIAFLASLLPEPEPGELPPAMPLPKIEAEEELKLWTLPEWLRTGLRFTLNLIWLGLILVTLWRISSEIFGWMRRKLANMADAEVEPLSGAFKADFFGLLKRILFRLLRLRLPWRLRAQGVVPSEIASVRQIYHQLLRWAAAGGYPRHISQTPHEYCHILVDLLPEVRGELDLITQHYVRVRYGAWLPTEDELYQVRQSWHNVRQNHLKERRQV